MNDVAPIITPARYAKDKMAASCPSSNGFKSRAARLAEHLNARYSHRECAYILSSTKAIRLVDLFDAGRDASPVTGALYPLEAPDV